MKFIVCLSSIIFVFFFAAACSKNNNAESEEVFIDDGFKTVVKDEIVIEDSPFENAAGSATSRSLSGSREITIIAPDGSQLTTMYDAFGNKTEKRVFDGDTLLQLVAVRTSVKGDKQISVYAQNGAVKQLPPDMLEKVLTATADELATAAGIYEGRREETAQPMIVQTNQPRLQPMPSYRFPIQQPQVESAPVQPTEPETNEPAETTKPEGKTSTAPKSNGENTAPKTPSGEQK
jgi:YD repeat-containing protein